jgi:hypothetical protein
MGPIEFRPEVAVINFKTLSYIAFNTTKFGKIAVPLFSTVGGIPKNDQNKDPFADEDRTARMHVYYLEPEITAGHTIFKTRMIDNFQFRERFKKQTKAKWNMTLNVVDLLIQSKENFEKSKALFIASSDTGASSFYYQIQVIEDAQVSIHQTDLEPHALDGNIQIPVTILGDSALEKSPNYHAATAYFGAISEDKAMFHFLAPGNQVKIFSQYTYIHERKRDHLLSPLAGFIQGKTSYGFMESKGNLVASIHDGTREQILTHPIHRQSFTSGNIFTELYFPIVSNSGALLAPAFYIDATQLNSGHIYILTIQGDHPGQRNLISPIKNNILVPTNCRALNPVSLASKKEAYSLLCLEEGEWELWHLPIH